MAEIPDFSPENIEFVNDVKSPEPDFSPGNIEPVKLNNSSIYDENNDTIVNTNDNRPGVISYMTDTQVAKIRRESYFGQTKINQEIDDDIIIDEKGTIRINPNIIQDIIGKESKLLDVPRAVTNLLISTGQDVKRFGAKLGARAILNTRLGLKKLAGEDISQEREDYNSMISNELVLMAKDNQKYREGLGVARTEYDGLTYDLGSTFTQMGMNYLLKSPTTIGGVFFAQQQQTLSEEVFERTGDVAKAEGLATLVAIPSALVEYIGTDRFLKAIKGDKIITNLIKAGASEAIEEAVQGLIEETIIQKYGGREKELIDTVKDIAYESSLAFIGAGTTAGMINVAEARFQEKKFKNTFGVSKKVVEFVEKNKELHRGIANVVKQQNDLTTNYGNSVEAGVKEALRVREEMQLAQENPTQLRADLVLEARGSNLDMTEQELLSTLEEHDRLQEEIGEISPSKGLIEFIKENGGIFDEDGELTNRGLADDVEIKKDRISQGQDVSPEALELKAFEAGLIDERLTSEQLFDAIEQESKIKISPEDIQKRDELQKQMDDIKATGVDIEKIRQLKETAPSGRIQELQEVLDEDEKVMKERGFNQKQIDSLLEDKRRELDRVTTSEQSEKVREARILEEVEKSNENLDRKIVKTVDKSELGFVESLIKPISSALKDIDPKLAEQLRSSDLEARVRLNEDLEVLKPFFKKANKLKKIEANTFDMFLKNSYWEGANQIAKKNGFQQELSEVRNLLDRLWIAANESGSNFGYQRNYFPRRVKDYSGFISHLYGRADWGKMEQFLTDQGLEHSSPKEQAIALNLYLSGSTFKFGRQQITERGFQKERTVDVITDDINGFYHNSLNALLDYVSNINNTITVNKFFGKDPGTIEEGIGELLSGMVSGMTNEKKYTAGEQERIKKIFKDYFTSPKTNQVIQVFKNISYLTGLTSVTSTVTQFKDLYLTAYKNGGLQSLNSIQKVVRGKADITAAELGITKASADIEKIVTTLFKTDTGLEKGNKIISKLLKKSLNATYFTTMDAFGKNVFVQATLDKYTKLANRKNTKTLHSDISEAFGNERADTIIQDLKAGNISNEVKQFLFYKIADAMPISKTEMPSVYLRSPGSRMFYTFKTYTIKQLDILNQDVIQKIKTGNPKEIAEGFRNLMYITFYYLMVGVPVDMIKDWILRRTEDKEFINDYVIDNVLQIGGVSKWTASSIKKQGFKTAVYNTLGPPLPIVDDLIRDVTGDEDLDDWRTVKNIPVGGKLYYWWFGGGSD